MAELHQRADIGSPSIVARSPAMSRLVELAKRSAASSATILITGESGTGKGRIARFIHDRSERGNGPFVAIDCGSLPESLLETELFGYRKGAFTGATDDRQGLFRAAQGGTIFLDEIGETTSATQLRLLRVLEDRVARPVGSTEEIAIDVRVIAATNRNLENKTRSGEFRQDLFYRLRVVHLEVPPLRARKEDLVSLTRHFIGRSCSEHSCGPCALSPEALDLLMGYDWPGNVRELENAIERAVVLAENRPRIEPMDLPPEIRSPGTFSESETKTLTLAEVERAHILRVLEHFDGNRKRTAEALGIGETTLWRKLKSYAASGGGE